MKKGQALKNVMTAVVAIFIIALAIGIGIKVVNGTLSSNGFGLGCKMSVYASATFGNFIRPHCQTNYLTIPDKTAQDKNKLYPYVADKMLTCFAAMGSSNYPRINAATKWNIAKSAKQKVNADLQQCFVCFDLTVKTAGKESLDMSTFSDYLKTNSPSFSSSTFAQLLYPDGKYIKPEFKEAMLSLSQTPYTSSNGNIKLNLNQQGITSLYVVYSESHNSNGVVVTNGETGNLNDLCSGSTVLEANSN